MFINTRVVRAAVRFVLISLFSALSYGQPSPQTVLLSGDPAPGVDPPVNIRGFTGRFDFGPDNPLFEMPTMPTPNDAGRVVFWGRLAGGINVDYDGDGEIERSDLDAFAACSLGPGVPLMEFRCLNKDLDHDGDVDGTDFARFQRCYSGADFSALPECTDESITAANDGAMWAGVPGQLVLVAREGSHAPGTPEGVMFDYSDWDDWDIQSAVLNAAGRLAMVAPVGGPSVTRDNGLGIWVGPPDQLELVARAGDPLPGMPAGKVAAPSFWEVQFNDPGQIAFITSLVEPDVWSYDDQGLWMGLAGDLHLLLRTGEPAPGFDGAPLAGLHQLAMNNTGQLALTGGVYLPEPGIGLVAREVLWSNSSGGWTVLAREGDVAPGTAPGVTFSRHGSSWGCFGQPLINEPGQIAFESWLGNAEPEARGIWCSMAGELQLLMWTGAPPPGFPADTRLRRLWMLRVLSDTGQVAVAGELQGPGIDRGNNHAVWFGRAGDMRLLAREGDPAPDTPPGTVFSASSVSDDDPFWSSVKPAGVLLLFGNLSGPGVTDASDFGVWGTDCYGQLQLLVREGQLLEVRPGDFRTIAQLQPGEGNDLGQLAFWARFTDGSEGVFLTQPRPADCGA